MSCATNLLAALLLYRLLTCLLSLTGCSNYIQGVNLTLGSNWTTDGSVFIGGVRCSILDVTMSRIHFQPPDARVSGMNDLDQMGQNVRLTCKTTTDDSSLQSTSAQLNTIFPLEVCALSIYDEIQFLVLI